MPPARRLLLALACLGVVAVPSGHAARSSAPRPHIVSKPISFPADRRTEMRAYARRHYALDTWRLRSPKVIVEHITVSSTFSSAFSTFNADVPDQELHELPGTCAHFVIDTDGTVYQLVPLGVMCRHTVGLNWTAIGIEHVGMTDGQVMGNARQIASSIALTAWLMSRFHIKLGDVIGHNESLTSRFHKELYPGWRCQTHGDFVKAEMKLYRARLAAVAKRLGISAGGAVHRVTPRC